MTIVDDAKLKCGMQRASDGMSAGITERLDNKITDR